MCCTSPLLGLVVGCEHNIACLCSSLTLCVPAALACLLVCTASLYCIQHFAARLYPHNRSAGWRVQTSSTCGTQRHPLPSQPHSPQQLTARTSCGLTTKTTGVDDGLTWALGGCASHSKRQVTRSCIQAQHLASAGHQNHVTGTNCDCDCVPLLPATTGCTRLS